MEIFLTAALMYGLTFSIKDAKLLHRPRTWLTEKSDFLASLLDCPFCTGFHSGWISFIILYFAGLAHKTDPIFGIVVYAFASAALSYVVDTLMLYLERN